MPSHLIDNTWHEGGGPELRSIDPCNHRPCWSGRSATAEEVDEAVAAARSAFGRWSRLPPDRRLACVQAFADRVEARQDELAEAICTETGKPRWEARAEANAVAAKVPISVQAQHERCHNRTLELTDAVGHTRYKPVGVFAVLGPFNFPAHLPNGHIVPALLAGNTVVFKPSEHAPSVGQVLAELWQQAGLPPGVFNAVQGDHETGRLLSTHPAIDGLLFTGSYTTGQALSQALAHRPEVLLALEMGGNNPLVVWDNPDPDAAAMGVVLSAYITAGQRCSCARRLILPDNRTGAALLERLAALAGHLRVGAPDAVPEPFMGPVISAQAADRLLDAQDRLLDAGAEPIVEMQRLAVSPAMLSPGLLDVTDLPDRPDQELFGPLLQVIRVSSFHAAIDEANRTAFGLVAGLFSRDRDLYHRFYTDVRAGLINWNRPTTGASSQLPFGGVGRSGNHRPAAYFAADYCTYPVASLEREQLAVPDKPLPGLESTPRTSRR